MPAAREDTRRRILDTARRIVASKGYAAVGLNEVLGEARVPKGSFYHFFASKDAFGQALLDEYFVEYLAEMDDFLREPGLTTAQRLMNYWASWSDNQSYNDCQGKCLAVKLGAEVADLSEPMRLSLAAGTGGIIDRLETAIATGVEDGSVTVVNTPRETARILYDLWMGASVMAKIRRDGVHFGTALTATRQMLHLA
ncbi:TetR/AcrR family transcriptional regulator [Actinoplanes sp. L3-i22]|uniref:TetR/AcrR family transcriptional regulator n=1 Tax=Actinoplanes sp. L3-i22 TaxID=2836373 RepID=UPI001C75BAA4|nr:TetR/AcrR family transcriptional regulator [Actinoplanes sp. L3-i22]BCY09619.1 TetR family transcriptional regulator [Actinoplanes sp. L3-i22]